MTPDEFKKAITMLAGLFPTQITQAQASFLRGELSGFDFGVAVRAIKNHRASHDFVNIPQLLEGCRAEGNKGVVARDNSGREESWVDIQRRMNPQFDKVTPLEIVLRVHRAWWHRSGRSEGARRAIESSCRGRLIGLGMAYEKSGPWISAVFEPGVDYFRRVLSEASAERLAAPDTCDANGVLDFARAELGGQYLSAGVSPTVILIKKFTLAWEAAKANCVDETALCRARCVIYAHAKHALIEEAKESEIESEEAARNIMELAEGERLVRPDPMTFRQAATEAPAENRDKQLIRFAKAVRHSGHVISGSNL